MKLTCISDTHTRHKELELPGGEVLIHSGDFMSSGYNVGEVHNFLKWFEDQDYEHKILIAGNHDRLFEDNPTLAKEVVDMYASNIHYLQDSSVVIDGVKFYGSPWTLDFCNWAFRLSTRQQAVDIWHKVPEDTDVLITHGPAYGSLDRIVHPVNDTASKDHLGDRDLRNRIETLNPKVHICGHIHSSQGILDGYGEITTHINASCLDESYGYGNEQDFIEWEIK